MIDFLSNQAWISPQIDFLLFLQNIRLGNLEIFDKFFLSVTVFGEYWLPTVLCAIIYWCVDFKVGIYLFSLEGFNVILAHIFKMLACVYRPWVLDNRIHPSELAVPFAKGYSFPSGHSSMSASVFGGVAYIYRKNKLLCALLIGIILMVGFSRMWLGVHTPQDVVCGFLTGIVLVFALKPMIDWAEENKNRYMYLLAVIDILTVLALIFICCFNTYRMDYVDGKLLVDPQSVIYHTFILCAYGLGLINGCFLCRRFCPFNPADVSIKRRIVRGLLGSVSIVLMMQFLFEYTVMNKINYYTAILMMFFIGIFITLFYPCIFTKLKKI